MMRRIVMGIVVAGLGAAACAQTGGEGARTQPASTMPAPPPATGAFIVGPSLGPAPLPALDPKVAEVLKILQDRPKSLKDFKAKVDYSVEHLTGDIGGKTGTIDFLVDPNLGPQFSVDFTMDTSEGKPLKANHYQLIFDGHDVVSKDFQAKQYTQSNVLPPGAKAGDAVSLNGAMPLPIGLDVGDVHKNFEVTLLLSKELGTTVLRLAPRVKGRFEFSRLDVTVDDKLQLPVKMVQTAPNKDITTILLQEIAVNTVQAKMLDMKPGPAWTLRGDGSGTVLTPGGGHSP